MDVDLFDYELPPDFIAQTPINPRDAARLLDLTNGAEKIALFRNFHSYWNQATYLSLTTPV